MDRENIHRATQFPTLSTLDKFVPTINIYTQNKINIIFVCMYIKSIPKYYVCIESSFRTYTRYYIRC